MTEEKLDFCPGMIIVYFEEGVSLERVKEICTAGGGALIEYFDGCNAASVAVPEGAEGMFVEIFAELSGVIDAELNYGAFEAS